MSEFGRVCERKKLRVNVGKSKFMKCSKYGNGGRLQWGLNIEPLEEVDMLSTWGKRCLRMEDVKGIWYTE